jgi:hypothetical protein
MNETSNVPQVHKLDEMERMANAIAKSGLFGVTEPLQAMALMLLAQAEGKHPASIAQDYDIIQGRAARKTHSILSRFQEAGGTVRWIELSDKCAKAEFSHPSGGSVEIDWDMARAARTKVYNKKKGAYESLADRQMYQSYPRPMLRARCISEGVRAIYPAAIGGMLSVEEAQDEPIDMGSAQVVEQPRQKVELEPAKPRTPVLEEPDLLSSGGSKEPLVEPPHQDEVVVHSLSDCLALLDEHALAGDVRTAMPTLRDWEKSLPDDDRQALDSTVEQLLSEQAPPKKLLVDGQKRILRARLKSTSKTIAELEAKFGPLDAMGFDEFDAAQKFIMEAK